MHGLRNRDHSRGSQGPSSASGGVRTNSQGKRLSPLRSKVAQGFRGSATGESSAGKPPSTGNDYNKRLEDEMYERRRQGELRR